MSASLVILAAVGAWGIGWVISEIRQERHWKRQRVQGRDAGAQERAAAASVHPRSGNVNNVGPRL